MTLKSVAAFAIMFHLDCVFWDFEIFDESLKFRTTLRITQSEAQSPFKSSHLNRHRSSSGGIDGAIDDARDIFSYVISLSTRYHVIITETWARARNKGNSGKVT